MLLIRNTVHLHTQLRLISLSSRITNVHHLIMCIMQTIISKIINRDMLLIIGLQLNATGTVIKEVNIQSMKTLSFVYQTCLNS